jgi:hypothetical protein
VLKILKCVVSLPCFVYNIVTIIQDECQKTLCTVVCKQCKAFLCTSCSDKIHSLRLLHTHHRVPFEECFFTSPRSSSLSALEVLPIVCA